MKLIIDIPEEKYEWIKKNNPTADVNAIIGAIANGTPIQTVTNAEEAEAYHLPECKECRTCKHCMMNKNLPKITWMNGYPFIFCARHHEHFAPSDTCLFYKRGGEEE